MIKAIETTYKGYRFRSRLEARWAVFFDALGLRWEYEPEGVELPSGERYLPDFKVYGLGYFEIKPMPDDYDGHSVWPQEDSKEYQFFHQDGIRGGILYGTPGRVLVSPDTFNYSLASYTGNACDAPYFFCQCEECGTVGFQFDGRSARVDHKDGCSVLTSGSDKNYNIDSADILAACEAARAARFEHGARHAMARV